VLIAETAESIARSDVFVLVVAAFTYEDTKNCAATSEIGAKSAWCSIGVKGTAECHMPHLPDQTGGVPHAAAVRPSGGSSGVGCG